jgi:hypothetical protein
MNLIKPQIATAEITLPAARFRLRRLDPRNLVIERQNPRGGWLIDGYYGSPASLARALVGIAATLPDAEALPLIEGSQALIAAIDRNTAAIIDALAGDDGGATFGPRFGG